MAMPPPMRTPFRIFAAKVCIISSQLRQTVVLVAILTCIHLMTLFPVCQRGQSRPNKHVYVGKKVEERERARDAFLAAALRRRRSALAVPPFLHLPPGFPQHFITDRILRTCCRTRLTFHTRRRGRWTRALRTTPPLEWRGGREPVRL